MPNTNQARDFMTGQLEAELSAMAWEIPGPPHSGIELIQSWYVPAHFGQRVVLVEIYHGGGFEVFPQVMVLDYTGTVEAIEGLSEAERLIARNTPS